MQMKTIEFIKKNSDLILVYTPEVFYNGILERYRRDGKITIKRCFSVTNDDAYIVDDDESFDAEESVAFKIGEIVGDYYRLKKEIVGTSHNFYFYVDTNFKPELFVASKNISIL